MIGSCIHTLPCIHTLSWEGGVAGRLLAAAAEEEELHLEEVAVPLHHQAEGEEGCG